MSLPPERGRFQVTAFFAPVPVYQACDRFGFQLELAIDGRSVSLELPLEVKRYEPLRRSP